MYVKGIYKICFKDKCYVGKDSQIEDDKRLSEHIRLLKQNTHWNKKLQRDYNQFGIDELKYEVLERAGSVTDVFLCEREKHFIKKLSTYINGYNQTLGGLGMSGYQYNEEQLKRKSESIIGELNPASKLTNEEFFEIVELLKAGKTNKEIADIYDLHDRYVSLIRHKKRFQKLWEQVEGYQPVMSSGLKGKLDYNGFQQVVSLINDGHTNKFIEEQFNLTSGTVSRIRHRRTYNHFWKIYDENIGTFNDHSLDAI